LAYARTSKFISEATLPTLTFLGNSAMELYSLDVDSSYQNAFVYIRQLTLHVRLELQKKIKEPFQVVYCWQYLNSCKAWIAVLSAANPGNDELYSLLYPLIEIIWGAAKLLSLEQPKKAFMNSFSTKIGGLSIRIESIVRSVLDGRVIQPADEEINEDSNADLTKKKEAKVLALLGLTPVKGKVLPHSITQSLLLHFPRSLSNKNSQKLEK